MIRTAVFLVVALLLMPVDARATDPVRLACVGDSITQGVGTADPVKDSYPAQLQKLLGPAWKVQNFGVGGRTMLRKADPFDHRPALESGPAVVIIALGTNDSKSSKSGTFGSDFMADFVAMIKAFQALSSHPRVWACLPPPAFPGNWGITEDAIREAVIPAIKQAAQATGIGLIDLHTPLLESKALFPDRVHPNEEGAKRIAEIVAKTVSSAR